MTTHPFLAIDQKIMGDVYTSSESWDNLTTLCDEFGSRFGGTPGEKQAAEFMRDKLIAYGLKNVHLESFSYEGWHRGEATLTITDPVQETIDCISLPHSPPADLEAGLIDMGDGDPDAFTKLADDIRGKIVITTSEVHPGNSSRWVHRNEKYGRALLAGAVGFIFMNHYPGYGPATGGIGEDGAGHIPGFSVSYEHGRYLQRLLAKHDSLRLRLHSTDRIAPLTSWNVIGDLPGSQYPDEIIMLGSHYDGHDIAQGAADPASGTVAVMEAARVLAQYTPDLPRTVRVALWGVEEIGLIGSTKHVDMHADTLDNIRFYLNMDMAGAIEQKDIILNQWPELTPIFEAWSSEMTLRFKVGQSVNAHSDHYPFLMAGVPTGGIGDLSARSGRGYGHTRYDTLDKVEPSGVREAAVLSARLALRMAHSDNWPAARRSAAAVYEVLDNPANREETAVFNKIRAFYTEKRKD